jgi:hypothetical protein
MLTQLPADGHAARLVDEALTALHDGPGLEAHLISMVPPSARDHGYDAEIDIIVGDSTRRYLVECKTTVDRREHARKIKHQLAGVPKAGLLITTHLSREIARYCREIDLQFIDTHGNAYLKGPGLLVYVAGERHERGIQPTRSSGSVTGVAGLRIAFALLSRPDIVAAPYREIASTAGVSLGAVSNALEDLERRGYVIDGRDSSRRRLLEPQRLFDEWAINYPIQLRQKLNARRFNVPNPDWWTDMQLESSGAVWSGDVAARQLTQYLKPATQTVYVEPSERNAWLKELVTSYRAKPDPNGSLEVLDKFWGVSLDPRPGIAPAVLVYADLLASLDPRAEEAAQLIRKDWINESFHPS